MRASRSTQGCRLLNSRAAHTDVASSVAGEREDAELGEEGAESKEEEPVPGGKGQEEAGREWSSPSAWAGAEKDHVEDPG